MDSGHKRTADSLVPLMWSHKGSKKAKDDIHIDEDSDSSEEMIPFVNPFTMTQKPAAIAQDNDTNLKPAATGGPFTVVTPKPPAIAHENEMNLKPAAADPPATPNKGNPKESSFMAKESLENGDKTMTDPSLSGAQDNKCQHSHEALEEIDNLYYTQSQIKKRGKAPVEHCAHCNAVFFAGRNKPPADVLQCKVDQMKPVYACRGAKEGSCDYGICWDCHHQKLSRSERNAKPPVPFDEF